MIVGFIVAIIFNNTIWYTALGVGIVVEILNYFWFKKRYEYYKKYEKILSKGKVK